MANDNHLLFATCYNVIMQKQDYYNEFFELGQSQSHEQQTSSQYDYKFLICTHKRSPFPTGLERMTDRTLTIHI